MFEGSLKSIINHFSLGEPQLRAVDILETSHQPVSIDFTNPDFSLLAFALRSAKYGIDEHLLTRISEALVFDANLLQTLSGNEVFLENHTLKDVRTIGVDTQKTVISIRQIELKLNESKGPDEDSTLSDPEFKEGPPLRLTFSLSCYGEIELNISFLPIEETQGNYTNRWDVLKQFQFAFNQSTANNSFYSYDEAVSDRCSVLNGNLRLEFEKVPDLQGEEVKSDRECFDSNSDWQNVRIDNANSDVLQGLIRASGDENFNLEACKVIFSKSTNPTALNENEFLFLADADSDIILAQSLNYFPEPDSAAIEVQSIITVKTLRSEFGAFTFKIDSEVESPDGLGQNLYIEASWQSPHCLTDAQRLQINKVVNGATLNASNSSEG